MRSINPTEHQTKIGVYQIFNVKTKKRYIGSSLNLKKRLTRHKLELTQGIHHSIKLQRAWNKHGCENFIFEVIEKIENKEDLIKNEQKFIDLYDSYNNGYNSRPKAENCLGMKQSAETVKKRIDPLRGIKRTEEVKNKIREGILKAFQRPEVKKNLKNARLKSIGRKRSKEDIIWMSIYRRGKKPSEETKKKMSIAQKKRKKVHPLKDKILKLKDKIINTKKSYLKRDGSCLLLAKEIGCCPQYLNKVIREMEKKL